ncbi:MAG: DmsE family decaheme c-type cytochrome [Nitrospirota bacterium]|jgi:DmsE family decaheme c-type cytochrome
MANRCLILIVVALALLMVALAGCESLKRAEPIIPIKEYEKMIVGRFDANYVGTDNCLSACHFHDKLRKDFEASTMGAQMSGKTGMPIVDCESCHGPGSLAIEGITKEKVQEDAAKGIQTACDYKTFIDINSLPAPARSLICLKCHTANATFNLHNWNTSEHAINDVSCSDCHQIHAGPDLIVKPRETYQMCYGCHQEIRVEFSMPNHHPVPEGKITCIDCHDAHGAAAEKMLRQDSVKATCTQCHAEKEGPFLFEHADLTEECTACHEQHGSVNSFLLKQSDPFLCLQCHAGHPHDSTITFDAEQKAAFYTRCTDCHSTMHGTDIPSVSGSGRFTQ